MHSEILCFLDFLPFLLHKVTTSLRIYVAALLSDQGGNVFLGLNLVLLCVNYLLLVNYLELELWRMVPVNRQSLKYPINVTFTFSFFPQRKRKSWQGI